jgi:hypothetical protein
VSDPDWTAPPAPDLARIRDELDAAVAEAFDAVVRWEWQPLDAVLERPGPFAAERVGRSPVRLRRNWAPRDQTNAMRYGWDGHGRLRVARQLTELGRRVVPQQDDILTYRFNPSGDHLKIWRNWLPDGIERPELRLVTRRTMEGGRLVELVNWDVEPWSGGPLWVRERYECDTNDRIIASVVQRDLGSGNGDVARGAPQRRIIRYEGTRDEAGSLTSLHRQEFTEAGDPDSERELVWQETHADQLRSAQQVLAEGLSQAIRTWARRARPDGLAYCLAILYGDTWGPSLGLGTTAELARWGRPGSVDRIHVMWNPAEFACFDPAPAELNTPSLAAAYRVTSQSWGAKTAEKIRAACLVAAGELADDNLGIAVAEPFVVYAVDLELVDLERNFRKLGMTRVRKSIESLG